MSIQALRERLAASSKNANALLADNGDRTWSKEDQTKFDNFMDEIERIKAQIKASERLAEAEKDSNFEQMAKDAIAKAAHSSNSEVKAAVAMYMRFGDKVTAEQAAQIRNAMSTTTGSEGGFTVMN